MAMDKQTKQLAVLGGLVVVAGIVAYFMVFKGDDTPAPAPAPIDKSAMPDAGTPAAGGAPVTPAGPAGVVAPVVVETDPDMPTVMVWSEPRYTWPWAAPIGRADWKPNLERLEQPVFDPLKVQNMDVVDPERQASINKLKDEWKLQGIMEREGLVPQDKLVPALVPKMGDDGKPELGPDGKPILIEEMIPDEVPRLIPDLDPDGQPILDDEGNPRLRPMLDENGDPVMDAVLDAEGKPVMKTKMKVVVEYVVGRVLEAWFDGKRRPYRMKDRLPNTRFTVQDIFIGKRFMEEGTNRYRVRSGVVLLGDTGAEITIFLADDSRYEGDD